MHKSAKVQPAQEAQKKHIYEYKQERAQYSVLYYLDGMRDVVGGEERGDNKTPTQHNTS